MKLKTFLLMLCVFCLGVCAGMALYSQIWQMRLHRFQNQPTGLPQRITERLTNRLSLTEEQRIQTLAIFIEMGNNMELVREQSDEAFENIRANTVAQMNELLTSEQQELYAQFRAERQRIREQRSKRSFFPSPSAFPAQLPKKARN